MPKDPSEPAVPYVVRAQLANHRFANEKGDELVASGKGFTLDEANRSGLGEAIERYSSTCAYERNVVYAPRASLDEQSLDPQRLVLYRPEQYDLIDYVPYHDESVLGWVQARSLVTDELVLVPALAVDLGYQVRSQEEYLFGSTSSGLATGTSLPQAVVRAALEVIERDAFLITWLDRLPVEGLDPLSHPQQEVVGLVRAYERRGVSIWFSRLPTDHEVHVVACLGTQGRGEGPAAVLGLGADLDLAVAARRAILEVAQVRPALRIRLREERSRERLQELVADPHAVTSLDDHDLLYASPESLGVLDFLTPAPSRSIHSGDDAPSTFSEHLATIIDRLRYVQADLLYYDLTPPDMLALGVHTVRAVIPDFQPVDFGWRERRLGGRRLYELPQRLGLASEAMTVDRLNDSPHPLA